MCGPVDVNSKHDLRFQFCLFNVLLCCRGRKRKDISNMTQDAKLVHMSNKVFCRGPEDKSIAMTQHVNFLHMLNRPYGFEGSRGGKFSE